MSGDALSSAQQSSLARRMWTVGRDLRLRKSAGRLPALLLTVHRWLGNSLNSALPAVALLDTYGWDVDIARMYRLRLYRCPANYYDHVQDRVSVAPRSVGLHTRRQLQDAFADIPLQLPYCLTGLACRSSCGQSCSRSLGASLLGFILEAGGPTSPLLHVGRHCQFP